MAIFTGIIDVTNTRHMTHAIGCIYAMHAMWPKLCQKNIKMNARNPTQLLLAAYHTFA